jgi:formate hydrogenlyase subunit 6/NADH:ubiquinone oxidoreductase subunit I
VKVSSFGRETAACTASFRCAAVCPVEAITKYEEVRLASIRRCASAVSTASMLVLGVLSP